MFSLLTLSGELTTVQPVNDEAVHFEMVSWAVQQMHQGNMLPLDGWFPFLSLGDAQFSHYQSLPHLITAYFSLIFGTASTERWLGYLLFALFPISVYTGSRLLGWSAWAAGGAALLTPLLVSVTGYGYESFSYTWLGNGLWSQEWGMFLLPLAWGLSWRAVNGTGRGKYALAALVVGLTIAMHFLTGYFALLSIGVFVIVIWRGLLPRIGRAAIVFGGAALVASWVVVPLLTGAAYFNLSEFNQNTFWLNSWGAPKILGWLFTGQIFDAGRFPIVSLLVALGTVVCVCRFRSDPRARALLGLMGLSLVLFSGRPTFGLVLNLLPGSSDLLLHRYLMGVQLAGLMLAGVGIAWAGDTALNVAKARRPRLRLVPVAAGLMGAAVLLTLPAWFDRAAYAASDLGSVGVQVESDQTDGAALDVLLNIIKTEGGGRTYAGLPGNWGAQYEIGQVPVFEYLADNSVDEVGFLLRTPSLVADNEAYFNQNDPAQYQLYNVRYLLMPEGMQPPVPATLIASSGRHRLWTVATSGYLQVVDTSAIVEANRADMATQMQPFLRSTEFEQGDLATVAFNGGVAATPTLPVTASSTGPPGTSTDTVVDGQDGTYAGVVTAKRTAAVVLKATDDPGWRVTVDGKVTTPYMVVPGFVAVTVGPGRHTIVFQYVAYGNYPLLLGIGLLTLLGLSVAPLFWRRFGSPRIVRRRDISLRGQRVTGAPPQ
jgi:Bacterial membrane protein YfhO